MAATLDNELANLRRINAELEQKLDEALAREAATAEVLQVINSSPGELEPVFDAMLEKAMRLCEAPFGALRRFDGKVFRAIAARDVSGVVQVVGAGMGVPIEPDPGSASERLVLGEEVVHIPDVVDTEAYRSVVASRRKFVEMTGARTALWVALRKDDVLLGDFVLYRKEIRPFSDRQIALLQNFAAQAVIAMENARLLSELNARTSDLEQTLEYQTATSDVLQIISRSTFDLQPVLDTLVETAARLCAAQRGYIATRDEGSFRPVATFAQSPEVDADLRGLSFKPGRGTVTGEALLERRAVHVADITADPAYASAPAVVMALDPSDRPRSLLGVPLLREGEPVGVITLGRVRVEPFTDRQVELVRTFADQAVIAMENARLLTETREALEQQTATAEILRVISRSPADLQPTFDAIAAAAKTLTDATLGSVVTFDGKLMHVAAHTGFAPDEIERIEKVFPLPADQGTATGRAILTRQVTHVGDLTADPERGYPTLDEASGQTVLAVPMLRDGIPIGAINVQRRRVEPFSDTQIDLIKTFADQAVIAMENARLITETREALEQQTATAEVLQVINSSPGDLAPVFDAILEKARTVCGFAQGSLNVYDGDYFRTVATRGIPEAFAEMLHQPRRTGPQARFLEGDRIVHIFDVAAEQPASVDPVYHAAVEAGVRTVIFVPLRNEQRLLGYITANRREVRPFSDKEIALLENFAAQAVIAMENARLLGELRERTRDLEQSLEYQTATSDVLQVISRSTFDVAAVLEFVCQAAARLCQVQAVSIFLLDDNVYRWATGFGVEPAYVEIEEREVIEPGNGTLVGRVALTGQTVHIPDALVDLLYERKDDLRVAGLHTILGVPLTRDGIVIGVICLARYAVEAFSDKQIELVRTFADQAVIAMENARLISETREALEQQTATAEVLQVINSSPGNVGPVFDEILEKATRLCEAVFGIMLIPEGESLLAVASRGLPPALDNFFRQPVDTPPGSMSGRLRLGEAFVHIADIADDEGYRDPINAARRALVDLGGARTGLAVALRKDAEFLGAFWFYRREVRPFSDKQIALLQNFAAQAVIAMENARLLTETREALEQQTATAEVLQVINSSPGELQPVFDALIEKAVRLCGATRGVLRTFDGEAFHVAAVYGDADAADGLRRLGPARFPKDGQWDLATRLLAGERVVHVADARESREYREVPLFRAALDNDRTRTALWVALRKEETLLGYLNIYRQEVRPFSDKQIALVQNFAAQAVIAVENARLLTETREALEQQTATAEVLQVINASPGDLAPVWDAMLERATRLCEASLGILSRFDGKVFQPIAVRGVSGAAAAGFYQPVVPDQGSTSERLVRGEQIVHIPDVVDTEAYRSGVPSRLQLVRVTGARTALWVSLRKDDALVGHLFVYRKEVRPFTEKQIALLQNFAAQAVVAMENARLLDEIRQAQAELRVTFDNMGDGVVMFDEGRRLAAWNRNFQEMLDLPSTFLAGRPSYTDYLRILAKRGEFGTEDIEAELSRRLQDTDRELRLERTRPDGRVIEVRRNAVPDGGFVLIYSDITERKRSEAEIRAARDAAETAYGDLKAAQASLVQAEKMASLGQLTAGIAHEIKNPLNFVNNFAELSVGLLDELKETAAPAIASLGDEQRAEVDDVIEMLTGNLEKIGEHGRRADGIVRSMLEHSRGTTGERRTVDLNYLVDEALNLAYHGARAQDASFNITLERDFDAGIAQIELVPQDITRVCLNLISNGFYAATKREREGDNPKFEPTLRVTTRGLGEAVEICIRDNGIGIAPEVRDKLFQPFFTTKPTGEGTGLGLSISYDIVTQQHGGTIEVDSRVNEFTEFRVRLPHPPRTTLAQAAS